MPKAAPHLLPPRKFMVFRILFRYVSGRPLDGTARTDSSFFIRGTKIFTDTGRATRWAKLAGWQRATWRVGVPAAVVAGTWLHVAHPLAFWLVLTVITAPGILALALLITRLAKERRQRKTVRKPLTKALAPVLDMVPEEVDRALVLPAPGREEIRVPLPDHFSGEAKRVAEINRIVHQRVGGEWDLEPNYRVAPFYFHFTPTPAPPGPFNLTERPEVLEAIYATTQDKPVLGLGTRAEVVKLDFTGEIAHLAASIGTGGGKSSLLRFLMAQFAYHGCRDFEVIDVKMVSLEGMEDLPGLRYHRHIQECWGAIARIRKEMERRYEIRMKNPTKVFPRKIALLEEQNAFAELTRVHWKDQGGKGTAPVWSDITLILTMARQVNINLIGMYQRMSAKASGGGELRDQYGLKLLSRFSPQAWDALVGTRPRGVSSAIPGRAIAIMGELHRTVQIPFVSPEVAMQLALSGPPVTVTDSVNQQVNTTSPVTVTPSVPRYRLAEAAREPWCEVSYDTLKQRAHRAKKRGRFPVSIDDRYTQAELAILVSPDSVFESESR
jgi:hypothetical protein